MAACADSLATRTQLASADRDVAELDAAIDSGFRLSRELIAAVGLHQLDEPPIIDVHELLVRYQGTLRRLVGENLRIVVSADSGPALVRAIPARIEWLLLNLTANARDAMPEGGVIHIETARIERWSGPPEAAMAGDRFLRPTMRDAGVGMSDDASTRAAEPFFSTKGPATGLGLTSVAVTARALDGWFYIDSHGSGGTRAQVLLPLHPGRRPAAMPPDSVPQSSS